MSNWGIKVANLGTTVESTDIRDQTMNSEYSMFKYHSDGTVAISMGTASVGYGTVSHNLGYVPAYMSYVNYPDDSYQRLVPSIAYGVDFSWYPSAYANTANVIVQFNRDPYDGTITYNQDQIYYDLFGGGAGLVVGRATNPYGCAFRFPSVALNKDQSIDSANIEVQHVFSGTTTTNTKYQTFGIDEDNVGDVSTSLTKTTAVTTSEQSKQGGYFNFGINVKTQVEEIIARAGWSSGNNMGFILSDNGSDNNAYIGADDSTTAILTVVKTGALDPVTATFRVIVFKDKIV